MMVDVKVQLYLSMKGKGQGAVFDRRFSYLTSLSPESVRSIKLVVVNDDHGDDGAGALDWDTMTQLLLTWRWATSISIHDWPSEARDLESLSWVHSCPCLIIVNHKGIVLDVSGATVPQRVEIQECDALLLVEVGELTSEVFITDAANLSDIGTSVGRTASSLTKLSFKRCPMLQLEDMQTFTALFDLTIRHARFTFPDGLGRTNPIDALRATLKSLNFWDNVCPPELSLLHFPVLRQISVGSCPDLRNLVVRHCPLLKRITVRLCESLIGLLPGASDLPALTSLCLEDCPKLLRLRVHDLPRLQEVDVIRTGLRLMSVKGTTCPSVTSIKIRGNQQLSDQRCLLHGSFPNLACLQLDGNGFTAMPETQTMPVLQVLNLSMNQLQDPVQLSAFPSLVSISLVDNAQTPLHLLVNPVANPVVAGAGVVLVHQVDVDVDMDTVQPSACACCNPVPVAWR